MLSYIKIVKKPTKILIIIQRSSGDVFLSVSLIKALYKNYKSPSIDLLINDDTLAIAKLIPFVQNIHTFSYFQKKTNRWNQERLIFFKIFKKYDLSINLTSSDRSVFYALIAGKKSISAVERESGKSWWKKLLLNYYYYFDSSKHILLNNLESLKLLNINYNNTQESITFPSDDYLLINDRLKNNKINKFIIFHPSAQYNYKIYPKKLRNKLLNFLNTLGIPIIITGGNNKIDLDIKNEIPQLLNIYNFIGETTLKEYFILSEMSLAFIGMDTLNMHIAASQNKRIFAIFGPTKLSMWSPWSNLEKTATSLNKPIQSYGRNTIFQSSLPCEVCGVFGCGHNHGINEFSYDIDPELVFNQVNNWFKNG